MNYELAKRLKDAGFPQNENGTWITASGQLWGFPPKLSGEEPVFCPTLEELIEACGDETIALTSYTTRISMGERRCVAKHGDSYGIGATPREAVAYLWLKLHGNAGPSA
jgi:hypothetical protein